MEAGKMTPSIKSDFSHPGILYDENIYADSLLK